VPGRGRIPSLAVALLVAVATPLAAQEAPPTLESLLAAGDARHDAFDLATSRDYYERALELEPTSGEAKIGLAHVLNDLAAEQLAEAEGARAAGNKGAARDLSLGAVSSLERARDLALELREAWPARPEGPYWYAASLAALMSNASGPEKVRSAREIDAAARRAIALDPCFAPAWALLGVSQREVARIGWLVRGLARATLGGLPSASLDEAEGLLRAAAALDPGDPFPLYQLGLTLEARDRPREAALAYEAARCLPDREPRDRRNRADIEARLSREGS